LHKFFLKHDAEILIGALSEAEEAYQALSWLDEYL